MSNETDKKSVILALAENVKVDVSADANKAIDQITKILYDQKVDANAVIYNDTNETVQFYGYNDSDSMRWVSARKPLCPPKSHCLIDKGPTGYGPTIQVWVNDKMGPFYIKRNHAYIWSGMSFIELIEKEI
jgi:hypothetical protein